MKPRKYQEKAIQNFSTWWLKELKEDISDISERLATIILPTGTGKTKTATWAIQKTYNEKSYKVLWCAHREELINQAFNDLKIIQDADIQIEMAAHRAEASSDIIVGSVATLHRDRKNFQGFEPDLIVVDEWHHYDAKNVQYHGLLEKFPKAKILGLTATPFRFTGGDLPLGEKLIEMDIGTAVLKKYLVPPKPETLKTNTSLANVKTRAGDFATNELSQAVNNDERNKLIANRIIKAVKEENRQGILFGVDVAHAKAMADMLSKHVRVEQVYGETEKEVRKEIIEKTRDGKVDVFVNNLVATEGFDVPSMSFVCIARPTKSVGLFVQMMGRGLRLNKDKKDCLIIDVFDKVKVTQGRVTYQDVARVGDIDGSNRRSDAIMKEPIADTLKHFPVVMEISKSERWTVDTETWYAPAWQIDSNQWVIFWSKTQARKISDKTAYEPITSIPSSYLLSIKDYQVYHPSYGEGRAISVAGADMTVKFAGDVERTININELSKKVNVYEKENLKFAINRAIYIIANDFKTKCRVISLLKRGDHFSVETDLLCDKVTADEVVKVTASEDDMTQIVRADARWRMKPASDKQIAVIKKMVSYGQLDTDIDFSNITGGDASALMDQAKWKSTINNLFGSKKREELIGYFSNIDEL